MQTKARLFGFLVISQMAVFVSAQGLPPANPAEIVAGAQSCIIATGSKHVDQTKLEAQGWHSASVSQDGKAVATGLTFLGKDKLLLTFDKKSAAPTCFITAHLDEAGTFGDVAYAIDSGLGVHGAAKSGEANTIYWFPPDHIVQLSMTGTSAAPSVRVAVGYMPKP